MAGILSGYSSLIGPTGRALEAGQQKGMSYEDQARNGMISFNDAMYLKQLADETRAAGQTMQAQQMPQPQPTVVDDLRAQVMQGAGQPSRQGGIADLPAENVGNYNMASGGIVAFEEGGDIEGIYERGKNNPYDLRRFFMTSASPEDLTKMYTLALNKGDSNTAQIIKSELDRKRSPGETDRIRREIEQKRSAEEDANEARALAAQKSQFLTGQAPTAAPATAAAPNGAASLMAPPGSPFAIERGALPSGSSFEAAPEAPPTPVLSQAQIAEMFRTEPYVTGGGRSNLGLAGLASGTYKPSTDALDAQRKDIQGRKYDTAAEYEKLGIGAASKAQEAKINKQLDELPKDKRFAAMMALSEAGFRMAGTASKPGATFLGAAAEGGTEGLKSYTASRKDIRDREERLGDKQGALAQTREDLARLAADKDEALRRGDRDQLQQIALKEAELKSEESRLSLQLRDSAANRSAMMARDQDPTRKMTSLYYQLMLNGETEKADRVLEAMTAADRRLIETDRKARAAMDREIYKNENKDNIFGNLSGLGGGGYSGYKVFGPKAGS